MSAILGGKSMKKWEERYNEINPKIDSMIAEQNAKMNEARRKQVELGKDVDSQEYKQAKLDLKDAKTQKENLDKLKPNLKKVSNYITIRKQIEARVNEYAKVRNAQNEMINNRRQIGKCEQQEKEATEELKKLTDKLRNDNLSQTEKSEINRRITEAANKKQNAFNLRNQLNDKNNTLNNGLKEFKYGEVDRDTIKEKMAEEKKAIEILDKKCEELMDVKHVEDIYQQVMNKKEETNNVFDEIEQPKNKQHIKDNVRTGQTKDTEFEDIRSNYTFSEKHPRLAKIGNFFMKVKDKFFNSNKTLKLEGALTSDTQETELDETNIEQREPIELTDAEMDRLVKYIIEDVGKVGENSVESLRNSIKVTLSEEAKERLARFRADNGYRQGNTGGTMRKALNEINETVQEIDDGSR